MKKKTYDTSRSMATVIDACARLYERYPENKDDVHAIIGAVLGIKLVSWNDVKHLFES